MGSSTGSRLTGFDALMVPSSISRISVKLSRRAHAASRALALRYARRPAPVQRYPGPPTRDGELRHRESRTPKRPAQPLGPLDDDPELVGVKRDLVSAPVKAEQAPLVRNHAARQPMSARRSAHPSPPPRRGSEQTTRAAVRGFVPVPDSWVTFFRGSAAGPGSQLDEGSPAHRAASGERRPLPGARARCHAPSLESFGRREAHGLGLDELASIARKLSSKRLDLGMQRIAHGTTMVACGELDLSASKLPQFRDPIRGADAQSGGSSIRGLGFRQSLDRKSVRLCVFRPS